MIRPKIKWSSLDTRLRRVEQASRLPRRQFVISMPFEEVESEKLERTYKVISEKFGFREPRDMIVIVSQFCNGDGQTGEGIYEITAHNMIE